MPMVWYVPPLSPIVDLLADQGHDAEDRGDPVRRHRGAAHPGRVPRRALHRRAHRHRHRRAAQARRDAGLHARRDARPRRRPGDPGGRRDDRGVAVRDVPAHGDRQVRRPLRHPQGPRRAGPRARGDRLLARLRRGAGHVRVRPVRRGERPAGAGGGRDVPRAASSGRPPSATPTTAVGELRGRVNLLNWDGNGAPAGLFPDDAHGRTRRDRAAPTRPQPATTASCTRSRPGASTTPTAELARPRCPRCARPWRSSRLAERAAARRVSSTTSAAPTARRPAAQPTSTSFDLSRKHALYLSYWTDGDTRRRGEVLGRFKTRIPRERLPRRHPRRAARLPADGARVRGARRPEAGAALLQEYRPSLELLRIALQEKQSPYAGAARRRVRDASRASPRPTAPRCMAMVGMPGPTRPRRSGSSPTTRGSSRCNRPVGQGARDEHPPVGRPALPRARRASSAARSGATATTSSAGPRARRSSTSRGCCGSARRSSTSASCSSSSATSAAWSSPSRGPRRSASARASTTSTRCSSAASPASARSSASSSSSTAAARPGRSSWPRRRTTS